ncbi:hypothetical protein LOD99_5234 [Oopsacas minuta]|uniref:Uncharacterized protein n=1 Tax=Oopsacas minuta TaxID=111878 RepID=A0AAV7JRM1_9METZ|nr:hypothetical protein LOD99_5234 [Oopsacas minuta]
MSSIWSKVLVAIDQRNQILQARKATIDVEVSNLKSLLKDSKELREKWSLILSECTLVASAAIIPAEFLTKRKESEELFYNEPQDEKMAESTANDQSAESEEELAFMQNVIYVIVDSVITGLTKRYDSANSINDLYSFLWRYLN